MLRHLLKLVI